MRIAIALLIAATTLTPALAQEASPEGVWQDDWGTTLEISFCGEDATQLCAVLLDVQGESRTEENLAYVNQQIMQADMVAENQWQGTVIFEGNEAEGTLTHVAADSIEIRGCRALIFCETLAFQRV
ncbi:hypothetical protein [Pelagibacterium limicola]|uniref:hypothetical protein n=1 Tax=Pelagibacterium limicola TaxID=2791022 RepID=UPI0018AF5DA7|nr:hypothetical protein [Pelagibacterium limicola]